MSKQLQYFNDFLIKNSFIYNAQPRQMKIKNMIYLLRYTIKSIKGT